MPSLFTFNILDKRITDIPGLSTPVTVTVLNKKRNTGAFKGKTINNVLLSSEGSLLITHWGMSGPAILKLSAWGARILEQYDYQFKIRVNWVPEYHQDGLLELFMKVKSVERKTILRTKVLDIPKRLWLNLVRASEIGDSITWAEVSKQQLILLAKQLTN